MGPSMRAARLDTSVHLEWLATNVSFDLNFSWAAVFDDVVDIYENLEFLLGGGIGFSSYNDEVKSIGGVALGYDEDYTRFSGKFKTGANYSFTQQTYLQATYGFNYVDSNIENLTSSDFTAHSFNAKLVFNF